MKPSLFSRAAAVALAAACALTDTPAQSLSHFGTATLTPAVDLDGAGSNIDSIAFWEAPDPDDTLMFVTGKSNDLLEIWAYPFAGGELEPLEFPANVNGVAVDQDADLLYVSDRIVSIFSLPDLQPQGSFGSGTIGVGENNLDILKHTDGRTLVYVSDDHNVYRYDAATLELLGSFAPPVTSIETVLADDFYQMILVPEEQGPEGSPGVYAYHPDGTPFERGGTNRFGNDGEFDSDEEGILLYTFPMSGIGDDGTGFIVVSDQRADVTEFEFFDRQTWAHLGALRLEGVSNTDGIASTQRALADYPLGLFTGINDDGSTAGVGWDTIFTAVGWDFAPEAVRISPATSGPTDATEIEFAVLFSEPVIGFDDAADLTITHQGSASTGATITGAGASYTVRVTGISGAGSFTLAVNGASDVSDLTAHALAASVTSAPVSIDSPYRRWALSMGLGAGLNDGFADDPDGDGCANIKEFATDGDPLSGADDRKQLTATAGIGGSNYFTFTFAVRDGADFLGADPLSASVDGIVYSVAGSRDLVEYDEELAEMIPALDTDLPPPSDGWNYRTFRMTHSVADMPTGFMRLEVEPAAP